VEWLQLVWPQFASVLAQMDSRWSRKLENRLKRLIQRHVPQSSGGLLQLNYWASNLHMRFLNEALKLRSLTSLRRALQFGDRHATFPIFRPN
jgi:hypothetical protein